YAKVRYIKLNDVNKPLVKVIKAQEESERFDKPVLIFTDGSRLSLNKTNTETMITLFGDDDEDWVAQKIKLVRDHIAYNGVDSPAVSARAGDAGDAEERDKEAPFKQPKGEGGGGKPPPLFFNACPDANTSVTTFGGFGG